MLRSSPLMFMQSLEIKLKTSTLLYQESYWSALMLEPLWYD